jgi:uroporphyrinogen III methyltransferase/synthase
MDNSKLKTNNSKLPLEGRTVVITRAKEQAEKFASGLAEMGAEVIEFPVIKFVPPESLEELDRAVFELDSYNWIIFTSANGVEFFWKRVEATGKDSEAFSGIKICAVGPATAAALEARGLRAELVPEKHVAEGILERLGEKLEGQRFLLPTADIARDTLAEGLATRGGLVAKVTAYSTVACDNEEPGSISAAQMIELLETGKIDLISFTSSSTVKNFAARLATSSNRPVGELLNKTLVACIGPVTAKTARDLGLRVGLEASEFTIDNLVTTIKNHFVKEEVALNGR